MRLRPIYSVQGAAERLFVAMGLPPGEVFIHRFMSKYEKGWVLKRKKPSGMVVSMTNIHPNKASLWLSIKDMTLIHDKEMLERLTDNIQRDLAG